MRNVFRAKVETQVPIAASLCNQTLDGAVKPMVQSIQLIKIDK